MQHGKGPGALCGTGSLGALWQYTKRRESRQSLFWEGHLAILFSECERVTNPHEKLVLFKPKEVNGHKSQLDLKL